MANTNRKGWGQQRLHQNEAMVYPDFELICTEWQGYCGPGNCSSHELTFVVKAGKKRLKFMLEDRPWHRDFTFQGHQYSLELLTDEDNDPKYVSIKPRKN